MAQEDPGTGSGDELAARPCNHHDTDREKAVQNNGAMGQEELGEGKHGYCFHQMTGGGLRKGAAEEASSARSRHGSE